MTKLKYLDDYELSSTVNCLQGVNNLYIILMEEEKKKISQSEPQRYIESEIEKQLVEEKQRS